MSLAEWALVASVVAGVMVGIFLVTYMVVAPWWRSQEGQNIVLLSVIIELAVALAVVGRLGYVTEARVGSVAVWFGVAVVYAWRHRLLLRAQGMLPRRHRKPPERH